jgi:hypothetical protein
MVRIPTGEGDFLGASFPESDHEDEHDQDDEGEDDEGDEGT